MATISTKFLIVNDSDLLNLRIAPKILILGDSTFYVSCQEVIVSENPAVASINLSNVAITPSYNLPTFLIPPSNPSITCTVIFDSDTLNWIETFLNFKKGKKMFLSIGSNFEINFTVKSDLVDFTGSIPRILISFPLRYLPRLNRDDSVSCSVNSIETTCYLIDDRLLEIRYFSIAI